MTDDYGFGKPNVLYINVKQYNDLLEYVEWEKWVMKQSMRVRKQIVTKRTILQRKGKEIKNLSKRPYDYLLKDKK